MALLKEQVLLLGSLISSRVGSNIVSSSRTLQSFYGFSREFKGFDGFARTFQVFLGFSFFPRIFIFSMIFFSEISCVFNGLCFSTPR